MKLLAFAAGALLLFSLPSRAEDELNKLDQPVVVPLEQVSSVLPPPPKIMDDESSHVNENPVRKYKPRFLVGEHHPKKTHKKKEKAYAHHSSKKHNKKIASHSKNKKSRKIAEASKKTKHIGRWVCSPG